MPSLPAAVAVFSGPTVRGRVVFVRQQYDVRRTLVDVRLTGLVPNTEHGFHVHEQGNVARGCDKRCLGAHWNPDHVSHPQHAGDLTNNLVADANGECRFQFMDTRGLLASADRNIYGRSVVVHHGTDDCGRGHDDESLRSGNAGPVKTCAVIGRCTHADGMKMVALERRNPLVSHWAVGQQQQQQQCK